MNKSNKQPALGNADSGYTGRFGEDRLLADVVRWLWNEYPAFRRTWWHTPNESVRFPGESLAAYKRRLATYRAKGVVKGVHDLVGFVGYQFWTLELKVGDNVEDGDQEKFGEVMKREGALVGAARSEEEARAFLRARYDYAAALRESLQK